MKPDDAPLPRYFIPLLPLVVALGAVMTSPSLRNGVILNGILQVALFCIVAHIPTQRTKRMSYVDIAWPWGLVLIGFVVPLVFLPLSLSSIIIALIYITMGSRVGIRSIRAIKRGVFESEFPRYRYQKRRWSEAGKKNELLAMHVDVAAQGLLNMALLCVPAFLIAGKGTSAPSQIEWVGVAVWLVSFVLEWTADRQKAAFTRAAQDEGRSDAVCDVGLWRWSRHPNYFFEWMVWNGLIIASLSGLAKIWSSEGSVVGFCLTGVLIYTSLHMLIGLLFGTGAEPSEFYSRRKRKGYAAYAERTSRFVPRPPRFDREQTRSAKGQTNR